MSATRDLIALALLAAACGSPPPSAFNSELEQAATARRQGDDLRAAKHYERAAASATKPRDAEEARYRAADSYARAGALERARATYRELAALPQAERRERAAFALAELSLNAGQQGQGQAELAAAIRRYPSSGLARGALAVHVRYLREQGGPQAALAYLASERQALAQTELAETLEYRYARELDEAGHAEQARDAYLACARSFPYPRGAYWDDALYRAAEKELAFGAPRAALLHLTQLVSEQESANFNGSYERARYAEGQLLMGQIYRDQLHDAEQARRELRKVWLKHPTSKLADDALFQEALLARGSGDQAGTCEPLQLLVKNLPDSRYAPCAHTLCSQIGKLPGRACHEYIRREAGLP